MVPWPQIKSVEILPFGMITPPTPTAVVMMTMMLPVMIVTFVVAMTSVRIVAVMMSRIIRETHGCADGTTDQRTAEQPLLRRMPTGRKQPDDHD